MATKTISIDTDAYKRLKSVQKENESFSQVIKRVVWQPIAFEKMLEEMEKNPLSDSAIEAIEQVVARRKIATAPVRRRNRK
jgi:predicted CopG family antitoxin